MHTEGLAEGDPESGAGGQGSLPAASGSPFTNSPYQNFKKKMGMPSGGVWNTSITPTTSVPYHVVINPK